MLDSNLPENETSIQITVLMTPDMVNFSGKVHGGAILKLLDQVAYVCASRYSGHYVVTLSVDQVFLDTLFMLANLFPPPSLSTTQAEPQWKLGLK